MEMFRFFTHISKSAEFILLENKLLSKRLELSYYVLIIIKSENLLESVNNQNYYICPV